MDRVPTKMCGASLSKRTAHKPRESVGKRRKANELSEEQAEEMLLQQAGVQGKASRQRRVQTLRKSAQIGHTVLDGPQNIDRGDATQ